MTKRLQHLFELMEQVQKGQIELLATLDQEFETLVKEGDSNEVEKSLEMMESFLFPTPESIPTPIKKTA